MKKNTRKYSIIMALFCAALLLAGCASSKEAFKKAIGASTEELEQARKNALVRTFSYGYSDCYGKVEGLLKNNTSFNIYANDPQKGMIAVYYVDINTTPVGLFFKEIDASHTRVEVASQSTNAKIFMMNKVLSKI